MTFDVTTTGDFYDDEEHINDLEFLGFTFTDAKNRGKEIHGKGKVELFTLHCLLTFVKQFGRVIIEDNTNTIELYDDYRE